MTIKDLSNDSYNAHNATPPPPPTHSELDRSTRTAKKTKPCPPPAHTRETPAIPDCDLDGPPLL